MSTNKKSAHAMAGEGDAPDALTVEHASACGEEPSPIKGLTRLWSYEREWLPPSCYLRRWRMRRNVVPMPQSRELKPVDARPAWLLYFIYAPTGRLDAGHLFTLDALERVDLPVLAVVATGTPDAIPERIIHACDAVIWKALSGYDFSAYAIGLDAVARRSPGADVLVLNDSVFGPFHELKPFLVDAPWDLTGFMATDTSGQRHVQSYAFVMKDVRRERLDALGDILTTDFAFDDAYSTISCRELWMARKASQTMSVGAYWYGAFGDVLDPTLSKAIELIDVGFPFLKRSLFTKQSNYQRTEDVIACLRQHGHPVDEFIEQMQSHVHPEPGPRRSLLRRAARKLLRTLKQPAH